MFSSRIFTPSSFLLSTLMFILSSPKYLNGNVSEKALTNCSLQVVVGGSSRDCEESRDWDDAWTAALAADGRRMGLGSGAALLLVTAARPALTEERRLLRQQRLLHARGLRAVTGDEGVWSRLRKAATGLKASSPRPAALLPPGADGVRWLRRLQVPPGPETLLLPLSRGDSNATARRLLADTSLRFDSGLLLARRTLVRGAQLQVMEAWRAGEDRPIELRALGVWSPHEGFSTFRGRRLRARANLRGVTFRAVAAYRRLSEHGNTFDNLFQIRMFAEIWGAMQSSNNFTTKWIMSNLSIYGTQGTDGSWNGVMGELASNRADVAICDMTDTKNRRENADFPSTVINDRTKGYVRVCPRRSLRWTDFLSPFRGTLWAAAVGCALLLTLALIAALRVRSSDAMAARAGMEPRDACLFVAAAFCQQGQRVPGAWSGRVVCICAHLLALVLAAAHSGALISALSAGDEGPSFRSLREALNDPDAKFIVTENSGILEKLQVTNFGDSRKLSERIQYSSIQGSEVLYSEQIFHEICNHDKVIGLINLEYRRKLSSLIQCEVRELKGFDYEDPLTFGLSKNNPYTDFISYIVRRMRRVGVVAREVRRHWPQSSPPSEQRLQPSVRLGDVAPVFAALGAGALLALLLLALERRFPPLRQPTQCSLISKPITGNLRSSNTV